MSDNSSFNSVGDQIKDALTDALQNGNFQTLNDLVSQTVTATLDEVGIHISPTGGSFGQSKDPKDIPLWQQALGPDSKGTGGNQSRQQGASDNSDSMESRYASGWQTQQQQQTQFNGRQKQQDWQQQEQLRRQREQQQAAERAAQEQERLRQERLRQARQEQIRRQQQQQQAAARAEQERFRQQQQAAQEQLRQERFRQQQQAVQRRQQEQLQRRQQAAQEQERLRQRRMQTANQSSQEQLRERLELRNARTRDRQMRQMHVGYTPDGRINYALVQMRPVGRISNVLYKVFGGIGSGCSALLLITAIATYEPDILFVVLFFLSSLLLFGFMLTAGIYQGKRLWNARRYVSLCDPRMFGQIADLAKATGKSEKRVAKDLQNMLSAGMFPEGHLDKQRTCFMLNDTVFHQYLEAENNRKQREAESRQATGSSAGSGTAQTFGTGSTVSAEQSEELGAIVREGNICIQRLHELNDQIPGEVISAKLYTLENLLRDIFAQIQEHPEQIHRIHKLMEYYLPTTLKLVETYADFDQVSAPGTDIQKAKAEIENTLDTINQAFTELLNNLFQDAVFDATTDAQVLKTMLAKEGLTKDMEFTANNAQGGKSDEQ